jgi:hypothetical protein
VIKLLKDAYDPSVGRRAEREQRALVHLFQVADAEDPNTRRPRTPRVSLPQWPTKVLRDQLIAEELCIVQYDYTEGHSLATLLLTAPPSVEERQRLARALVESVDWIHAHGVAHGDLKPSNLLVTPQGQVVLIDFGSAVFVHQTRLEEATPFSLGYTPCWREPQGFSWDTFSVAVLVTTILSWSEPAGWISEIGVLRRRMEYGVGGLPEESLNDAYAGAVQRFNQEIRLPDEIHDWRTILNTCLNQNPDQRPLLKAISAWMDSQWLNTQCAPLDTTQYGGSRLSPPPEIEERLLPPALDKVVRSLLPDKAPDIILLPYVPSWPGRRLQLSGLLLIAGVPALILASTTYVLAQMTWLDCVTVVGVSASGERIPIEFGLLGELWSYAYITILSWALPLFTLFVLSLLNDKLWALLRGGQLPLEAWPAMRDQHHAIFKWTTPGLVLGMLALAMLQVQSTEASWLGWIQYASLVERTSATSPPIDLCTLGSPPWPCRVHGGPLWLTQFTPLQRPDLIVWVLHVAVALQTSLGGLFAWLVFKAALVVLWMTETNRASSNPHAGPIQLVVSSSHPDGYGGLDPVRRAFLIVEALVVVLIVFNGVNIVSNLGKGSLGVSPMQMFLRNAGYAAVHLLLMVPPMRLRDRVRDADRGDITTSGGTNEHARSPFPLARIIVWIVVLLITMVISVSAMNYQESMTSVLLEATRPAHAIACGGEPDHPLQTIGEAPAK